MTTKHSLCYKRTNFPLFSICQRIKETKSNLSKQIIDNFEDELKNFVQVCPKEMLNKLENPITFKSKIQKVS